MGRMKRFAEEVSMDMGYDGELTNEVLKEANRRLHNDAERERILQHINRSIANGMCEGCGEHQATHDFLCDACDESMREVYGDPIEYTGDELDEMADAYYQQKDAEALLDPEHPEYGKAKI